mgnify:CR=1 FL=1
MSEFWPLLIPIGGILILLLLSGFFSGSETALTAVSRARMLQLEKDDNVAARRVNMLTEDRESLIGAILLGNNLVNILASTIAASVLLDLFGPVGVAYATLIMTLLVLIFAEVLPKTYALSNPDRVALVVGFPILIIVRLFSPVVAAVQIIVRGALRLLGARVGGPLFSAHDEIRGHIDLHHQEGGVVKDDRDMLGGVLDLRELTVDDVMVHRKSMVMIDVTKSPSEIMSEALASPHTRLPLYEGDTENIVGVLHARDMARALLECAGDLTALDIRAIAREAWFVPETTELQDQLNAFREKREHFALEEIVGEIEDEHDITVEGLVAEGDHVWVIDGSLGVRDINRALDWNLPDEEAVTVAGLVIHEAQTIPEKGQVFRFHGVRFEILEKRRNQITSMRVAKAPD